MCGVVIPSAKTVDKLLTMIDLLGGRVGVVTLDEIASKFDTNISGARNILKTLRKGLHITDTRKGKGVFEIAIPEYKYKYCLDKKEKEEVVEAEVVEEKVEEVEPINNKVLSLSSFEYEDMNMPGGGKARVLIDKDNNIWFFAIEIATKLGYRDAFNLLRILDVEDTHNVRGAFRKVQNFTGTIINESGLYTAILKSRKPEAKAFKRWVTSEVLPSIRRHGVYMQENVLEEMISNPDSMIKLLETLKKEREEKENAQKKIAELQPYVEVGKALETSENSILIGEWIKSISRKNRVVIGRTRAFRWMRENGYLMKNNEPYQKYIDNGYFELLRRVVTRGNKTRSVITTMITPKGQIKITPKIIKYFKR